MKDEEIDWQVYHLITWGHGLSLDWLTAKSGLDPQAVEASVKRLETYLLVQRKGERIEALSINESLIRCQIRHDTLLPFTIENGVIKEKKGQGP
ncbi:MAG: hypothetical protein A4E35_02190 [Methanoregula sp. PtaU1.Bin051]|nr:MAG: hypothetical protein A4E35_02190 [Methanoregula sp. PtaU1.Bin051]